MECYFNCANYALLNVTYSQAGGVAIVILLHCRYPLYVQAIPGGSSPMIYSAVVGPGGVSGTPQLVQWKNSSSTTHHAGICVCVCVLCVCCVCVMCLVS